MGAVLRIGKFYRRRSSTLREGYRNLRIYCRRAVEERGVRTPCKAPKIPHHSVLLNLHEPDGFRILPKRQLGLWPLRSQMKIDQRFHCPGRDLNPHVPFGTTDFKSVASAYSATRAGCVVEEDIEI